jgi:mycothiol synthase
MSHPLLTSSRSRPAAGYDDLPAIAAFYDLCETVDHLDSAPSLKDLQRRLDCPPPGGQSYRQLWETATGQILGIANLWIEDPTDRLEAWIGVRVDPNYRDCHLERELLTWGEQQVQAKATAAQRPARLLAGVHSDRPYYRNLYETQGYQAIRWFHEMQRSLTEPIPPTQWPVGFTSRPTQATEAEAWVEMFNQSFVDHWNFTPMTLADRHYRLNYPTYQPQLDWVAVAADGTLASFCGAHIPHEDNARKHRKEGWINLLGTRRGYRRQGLARAMLIQGLHQLQSAGLDTALLGVDGQNPNQAKGLYESVGFQVKESSITYEKCL